jgi:hypothetical protein
MNQMFFSNKMMVIIYIQIHWAFRQKVNHYKIVHVLGFTDTPLDLNQEYRWMGFRKWKGQDLRTINFRQERGAKQSRYGFDRNFLHQKGEGRVWI